MYELGVNSPILPLVFNTDEVMAIAGQQKQMNKTHDLHPSCPFSHLYNFDMSACSLNVSIGSFGRSCWANSSLSTPRSILTRYGIITLK